MIIIALFIIKDIFFIFDYINKFLDKFLYEYRKKVLSFCTKNNWKLSIQDISIIESNYDKLKLFILHEAQISQMQVIYNKKHTMREEKSIANKSTIESTNIDDSASTSSTISLSSTTSMPVSSISTSIDSSYIDSITKFIKQFTQLSLSL